ncbi:MAG TPA: hypothetical protein VN027_00415, partial [Isoptericola sp.]|nr:hypothetical protein [Isoptericola sp.]
MPFSADHRPTPHRTPSPRSRRPGPRARRAVAALAAPVLGLTLLAPAAHASSGTDAEAAGRALLHRIGAPPTTTADGPVWS